MKRQYESPEIQVIKYQKRVKTQPAGDFVDSSGVTFMMYQCPFCGKQLYSLSKDIMGTPAADEIENRAFSEHFDECPNLPKPIDEPDP